MQLVLCNNRIIAHGENFLALGGVVINTETGAKYDNATIAECEGCPTDINEVGYEYHAGVFVPCAPFGKGDNNGYFMEVCKNCATPRNSGLPIKDIKWSTIASISAHIPDVTSEIQPHLYTKSYTFSVSDEELLEYSMLRYVIKAGSTYQLSVVANENSDRPDHSNIPIITVGELILHKAVYSGSNRTLASRATFDTDIVCPCYLINSGQSIYDFYKGNSAVIKSWVGNGITVSNPAIISVNLMGRAEYYSNADIVIDLQGRK